MLFFGRSRVSFGSPIIKASETPTPRYDEHPLLFEGSASPNEPAEAYLDFNSWKMLHQ